MAKYLTYELSEEDHDDYPRHDSTYFYITRNRLDFLRCLDKYYSGEPKYVRMVYKRGEKKIIFYDTILN